MLQETVLSEDPLAQLLSDYHNATGVSVFLYANKSTPTLTYCSEHMNQEVVFAPQSIELSMLIVNLFRDCEQDKSLHQTVYSDALYFAAISLGESTKGYLLISATTSEMTQESFNTHLATPG